MLTAEDRATITEQVSRHRPSVQALNDALWDAEQYLRRFRPGPWLAAGLDELEAMGLAVAPRGVRDPDRESLTDALDAIEADLDPDEAPLLAVSRAWLAQTDYQLSLMARQLEDHVADEAREYALELATGGRWESMDRCAEKEWSSIVLAWHDAR